MKFFYESHSNKPGIYKIINTHTNRIYIGQAAKFERRWYGHKQSLLINKNQNKFLQNDYNKCKEELGHDDFLEFHVLEIMENSTKEERNKKEEFYIASVFDKQKLCYNFKEKTESKEKSTYSNTPEETSKKLSEASKQNWQNPEYLAKNPCGTPEEKRQRLLRLWEDPEYKEKMIEVCKRNANNEENKQRLIKKSQKTYNGLIAPDGTVHSPITNLSEFARNNNINYYHLYCLVTGKCGQYDGWKSVDNPNPQRKKVKLSEEHKKKIGESKKGNKYNLGRKHSEETKRKISATKQVSLSQINLQHNP